MSNTIGFDRYKLRNDESDKEYKPKETVWTGDGMETKRWKRRGVSDGVNENNVKEC